MRRRALLALVVLLLVPATAAAHGGTGMPAATDTQVVVVAITPPVPGLRAEVIGNDFELRLYLPAGAAVVVNRTAGARPLRQTGGTLTWREHRLRHPLPDGSLQIGFTLAGKPVVLDLASRRGKAPSPWPPIVLGAIALVAGILRPRWAPGLAVGAFVAMLLGAAGGLIEGRGAIAALVLCVAVIVLSALPVLAIAAVPVRFRSLTAGAFAAAALLLVMAQVPMLYRAYPVSAMPDVVARGLESVALALAIGALAAVIAGRPWRAFEADDPGLPRWGNFHFTLQFVLYALPVAVNWHEAGYRSCSTAKEVAVHTQPTTTELQDRVDRLTPVPDAVPVHERSKRERSSFTVDFADASPKGSVEVRYGLDPVANVWVASFLDADTGEVVKTVPATRVMHQLAELRSLWERSVDRRA